MERSGVGPDTNRICVCTRSKDGARMENKKEEPNMKKLVSLFLAIALVMVCCAAIAEAPEG